MTKFISILIFLITFGVVNCFGQHLLGAGGFYSVNTIGCDSIRFNKIAKMEPGHGFGLIYKHMELKNLIGFQAELNYEQQGFRLEYDSVSYYKKHLRYITIPLLAHVDIGKHAFKGIFAIGCYVNFLIGEDNAEHNMDATIKTTSINRIDQGSYNVFTYGLHGQAGFAICTKAGIIQITGRASIGMSKMMDMGEISLLNFMAVRSFGGGVSYLIPFGKGEKYFTKREKIKKENDEIQVEIPILDDKTETPKEDETPKDDPDNSHNPDNEENWEDRMER